MKLKKPSFKIILFFSKKLADGTHPVVIRATFDRNRRYYSLKFSAKPEEWNNDLGRYQAKRLTEEQRQANHLFNSYETRLKELEDYFSKTGFGFDKFEQKMFPASNGAVVPYFSSIIETLEANDQLGTARVYRNTRDKLRDFNNRDFSFLDVDSKFLQNFESFISKTCSPATVSMYLRCLRAVYNKAVSDGIISRDQYPFENFQIKNVKSRKRALSKDQIELLKNYPADKGSRLWESISLFLFSYYGRGMNLTDMANLRWDNIYNHRIYYKRKKTDDAIDIAIDDNLSKILDEYSTGRAGYIFPILENGLSAKTERYRIHAKLKKINEDLQSISGLPDDVTFYWARHTFATTLKRAGVSISVISESLGHSSEAVTKGYLDSFETSQLDEISKHL